MAQSETRVGIDGEDWLLNNVPTHEGRTYCGWRIEGLLLNSRMANAVFDDSNPLTQFLWRYPDTGLWDADRNTNEFVDHLPVYREHGLDAVSVNRQGAAPFGYFREMLEELQVSYSDDECNVQRYEHEILQPHRVHELIARAREHSIDGERLLVGTSYGGGRVPDDSVCEVSDFLMLHGNGVTDPARIANMVDETRKLRSYTPKPIMFTEDDHFNFGEPFNNFTAALSRGAGWGYFDPGNGAGGQSALGNYSDGYQNVPINWGINTPRKRGFFDLLSKVTGA